MGIGTVGASPERVASASRVVPVPAGPPPVGGARDRRLAHRRHALAQERDHLVLLAQVREQAVEGAGQDTDLVLALHRDGAGVGAVADPLDQADEPAHGPGDARGGAPGGEEPQRHDAERHEHEAVAELAEGGGLRGEAAQGERGPDLLAAGRLQRYPDADVPVAVEVDLEGRHLRRSRAPAGKGRRKVPPRAGPRDETARRAGCPGDWTRKAISLWVSLPDLGGDGLVEAVPGDQHADELGPGLHRDRHRGEELVALAPQRRGVLAVEGAAHDRVGREVVARGGGPVGPGHQHARGVGRHHEVGPEVRSALPERVEGRGLVALGEGRLEVGVVREDAHAELELVEAVGLDRLPDLAGLLEARRRSWRGPAGRPARW